MSVCQDYNITIPNTFAHIKSYPVRLEKIKSNNKTITFLKKNLNSKNKTRHTQLQQNESS